MCIYIYVYINVGTSDASTRERTAVLLNAISYNADISACEKGQQRQRRQQTAGRPMSFPAVPPSVALGLWAVTQRTAVLPNAISYDADIRACEKGQQCQRRQQTAGLPNVISYSAAISPCEKGQQWQQALGVLAMTRQVAGLRNAISYTAAFSACA